LLTRTVEKTSKQAVNGVFYYCVLFTQHDTGLDHTSMLLREGSGVCFVVEPSTASLPAFTATSVSVTAHSNMWGQYSDQLVCKVNLL